MQNIKILLVYKIFSIELLLIATHVCSYIFSMNFKGIFILCRIPEVSFFINYFLHNIFSYNIKKGWDWAFFHPELYLCFEPILLLLLNSQSRKDNFSKPQFTILRTAISKRWPYINKDFLFLAQERSFLLKIAFFEFF